MINMIEVEVLIPNFKDKENYKKKISITRKGKEIVVENELLQVGDIYKITKERYDKLSKLGIVKKITKEKANKEE